MVVEVRNDCRVHGTPTLPAHPEISPLGTVNPMCLYSGTSRKSISGRQDLLLRNQSCLRLSDYQMYSYYRLLLYHNPNLTEML